jgi:folylpolyglutamate synthase
MFTSPHLVTFRERFRLNGRPITEDRFLDHFWRIWDRLHSTESSPADTDAPKIPGFFHLLTLLAFAISSEEAVDVLVLEVGLGGRLDATNVVMNPVVCGVTRLDYDHVEVLGGTIAAIAREVRPLLFYVHLAASQAACHEQSAVRVCCGENVRAESWNLQDRVASVDD